MTVNVLTSLIVYGVNRDFQIHTNWPRKDVLFAYSKFQTLLLQ